MLERPENDDTRSKFDEYIQFIELSQLRNSIQTHESVFRSRMEVQFAGSRVDTDRRFGVVVIPPMIILVFFWLKTPPFTGVNQAERQLDLIGGKKDDYEILNFND